MRAAMPMVLAALAVVSGSPQEVPDTAVGTLTIRLSGFTHATGTAMVALVDSKSFLARNGALRQQSLPIRDGQAVAVLRDVPHGRYAVQAYHDENSNRRLDRNFLGIPSEPYGFSNGARPSMRAPAYDEAAFRLAAAAMIIDIRIR